MILKRWTIVLIHRPGLDSWGGTAPTWKGFELKRRFDTKAEAGAYAEKHFGTDRVSRSGWKVRAVRR